MQAFEALVQRFWDKLFRIAIAKTGDRNGAFDVVQDVFLGAWEKWAEIPTDDTVEFYLLNALKYHIFNFYRNTSRYNERLRKLESLLDRTVDEENVLAEEQLYTFREMLLDKAIDQLPPAMKELFILRLRYQYSYKKIASILQIEPGSARVMYSRALENVKAYIASQPSASLSLVASLPLFIIS